LSCAFLFSGFCDVVGVAVNDIDELSDVVTGDSNIDELSPTNDIIVGCNNN
jgi:hypothetical protein